MDETEFSLLTLRTFLKIITAITSSSSTQHPTYGHTIVIATYTLYSLYSSNEEAVNPLAVIISSCARVKRALELTRKSWRVLLCSDYTPSLSSKDWKIRHIYTWAWSEHRLLLCIYILCSSPIRLYYPLNSDLQKTIRLTDNFLYATSSSHSQSFTNTFPSFSNINMVILPFEITQAILMQSLPEPTSYSKDVDVQVNETIDGLASKSDYLAAASVWVAREWTKARLASVINDLEEWNTACIRPRGSRRTCSAYKATVLAHARDTLVKFNNANPAMQAILVDVNRGCVHLMHQLLNLMRTRASPSMTNGIWQAHADRVLWSFNLVLSGEIESMTISPTRYRFEKYTI